MPRDRSNVFFLQKDTFAANVIAESSSALQVFTFTFLSGKLFGHKIFALETLPYFIFIASFGIVLTLLHFTFNLLHFTTIEPRFHLTLL